jgi:uncharacterized protein YqgQ
MIGAFLQPQINHYYHQLFTNNKPAVIEKIKTEVQSLVPEKEVLKNLRFVTAKSLIMREQNDSLQGRICRFVRRLFHPVS